MNAVNRKAFVEERNKVTRSRLPRTLTAIEKSRMVMRVCVLGLSDG